MRGWWLYLAALCLLTVSYVVTYWLNDPMQMYRLMGYSEQQIEHLKQFNFLSGGAMVWSSLTSLPGLGYLIYVKRFF